MKKTLLVLAAVGALALSACSSDDSDATPGGNGDNQTPQATPQDNGDDGPPSGNICDMLADSDELSDDINEANDALDDLMADQASWNSPETVAALHAQGEAMLEYGNDLVFMYNRAAAQAGDPEVSAAFETMADFLELMYVGLGQAAVEANSVMDYFMNWTTYMSTDDMSQLMDDLNTAGPIISDYVYDTCGYSDFGF